MGAALSRPRSPGVTQASAIRSFAFKLATANSRSGQRRLMVIDAIAGILAADSDEAGRVFRFEAGHPFRFESGHHSDLKVAGVASPGGLLG
jgi:hypothetical protein